MTATAIERSQARIDPVTGTFKPISWAELKEIVSDNALARLTRSPEQLATYDAWKRSTVAQYGSIASFILTQRLQWSEPIVPASTVPFAASEDWTCLRNDFPYAFEPNISHLVVWVKFPLSTSERGTLTPTTEAAIEHFIHHVLCSDVPRECIVYFLNPPGLKSIGALEHFHVLLKDVTHVQRYLTSDH